MKLNLPCETCITRSMCRYKKDIKCSLLLETYKIARSMNGNPSRILEGMLAQEFEWIFEYTLVVGKVDFILITDFLSFRRI